jgi:hypothetical protein
MVSFRLLAAGTAGLAIVSSAAIAAPINYGDLTANTVIYRGVTEDSSTDVAPLYGAPAVAGDALIFNPTSFAASSSNGGPADITDGTLAFAIEAKPGLGIQQINFAEAGDYTLGGNGGTAATMASVSAPYFVRVVEVDNVSITPVIINGNFTFIPNGGQYSLPANAGVGITWTGSASIDIAGALAAANIDGKATRVTYSMDNALFASSEPGTVAFIKKKTVDGLSITVIVPEPTTLAAIAGLGALALRRRK